jgi:putative membrane protein
MNWWCAAQGVPWSWTWRPYPGVWLFIAIAAVAYWTLGGGRSVEPRKRVCFWVGLALLWGSLDWPLGALGAGYLASIHMVQFVLIALIVPPLLLSGIPRETYERIQARPAGRAAGRVLTHPAVALLLFALVVVVTHWPAVVDVLMATQAGSFALDMAWLGAGIVFWWPVVAPVPARTRFTHPAKVAYLILTTVVMTAPYIFLTFADLPFYATYELAPPVSGLGARVDQRIAGLVMRIGGGAVLWIGAGIIFYRWHRSENPPGKLSR